MSPSTGRTITTRTWRASTSTGVPSAWCCAGSWFTTVRARSGAISTRPASWLRAPEGLESSTASCTTRSGTRSSSLRTRAAPASHTRCSTATRPASTSTAGRPATSSPTTSSPSRAGTGCTATAAAATSSPATASGAAIPPTSPVTVSARTEISPSRPATSAVRRRSRCVPGRAPRSVRVRGADRRPFGRSPGRAPRRSLGRRSRVRLRSTFAASSSITRCARSPAASRS